MRGRRFPALALAAAFLAGCGTPPIDGTNLGLSRSTMRIPLDRAGVGGLATRAVMSLALANNTDQTLEIVGIEPATDDGLEVEYIGYSSCRRGCVGTGFWTAETEAQVERGLDGTYPVPVPSNRDLSDDGPPSAHLVFRFGVPTEAGVAALERGCLRLHGVSLELSDGQSVSVGESGESFVAALRIEEDREGYVGCDL